MPTIELRNLTKSYTLNVVDGVSLFRRIAPGRTFNVGLPGAKIAVDNVSLTINSGERVGIIGPNGAGKSSLLHMIAGIAAPTSGVISVDGKVTSILTLGIGLRDEASGRENVYLDGEIQGKTRREVDEVIEQIIDFADLGEFIDRPVRTYSTGMKARLAFAMISHIDPEILLIDEALSVGDAAFATKATRRIREICTRGKIVVVASHSLDSINEICTRCLWMDGGRIVSDGTPHEVTRAYAAAVHERDERELMEKFKQHVGAEQLLEGYEITRLGLGTTGDSALRATFPANKELTLYVGARTAGVGNPISMRLTVERLDGLLLVDETIACAPRSAAQGAGPAVSVEASLAPSLGRGVYKLGVELLVAAKISARRTLVFEVATQTQPTGGRPALSYPYSVEVEQIPETVRNCQC